MSNMPPNDQSALPDATISEQPPRPLNWTRIRRWSVAYRINWSQLSIFSSNCLNSSFKATVLGSRFEFQLAPRPE
jgi:hypothetical protein